MSFRSRLFATYALVIIICLAIVAITTTAVLQGYRDRLTMDRLSNIARPISVQVRSLATSAVTADRALSNLDEQAQKNNVYIILARKDGTILRQITPDPDITPMTVPTGWLPTTTLKETQGRFTTTDGRVFIYAAYPLGKLPTSLTIPADAIVLAVPRAGSLAILAGLMVPLLSGGIIALLISLVVAILFARSIYRPLNQMGQSAQKVASGNYDHRVPVEGPKEIRELASNFNHMTDEVKKSQQQLRHFVADVSHELKSPLTSIQGFSQALLDGTASDDATRSKAVDIINSESKRMRRQVDELLELSRMQSGQFKMARESQALAPVLSRCSDIFALQATEKGIKLTSHAEGPLPVVGDADRLEQLFCNLIDNAIKNTQSGGTVTVSSHLAAGAVLTTVTDNGPGIPQEQLPYVFERFYQVTGLRTGVGLGLAIAREIVVAHGGAVEARSQPGEGAEFVVRLPISRMP